MAEVTGIIQEIRKKNVAGGKTAYDIVVAGQAYGNGLYPPKAAEGDYVKFEVDESRGYKNVARNSLKVSKNKPPAEALNEAKSTAPQKSTTGMSVDQKQDVISRQAATNSAIAYLAILSSAGALAPPAAKGKGQEYMDTVLTKYTQLFYENNTGVKFVSIAPQSEEEELPDEPEQQGAPDDDPWG